MPAKQISAKVERDFWNPFRSSYEDVRVTVTKIKAKLSGDINVLTKN